MTSARGDLPDQLVRKTVTFVEGGALAKELCDEKRFRKSAGVSRTVIIAPQLRRDVVVGGDGSPPTYEHLSHLTTPTARSASPCGSRSRRPGSNVEPVPRAGGGGEDAGPVLLGGGKYAVARDQAVIVVLAGVNREPALFADPLAFDPDRMTAFIVLALLLREVGFEKVDSAYQLKRDGWFNVRPVDFYAQVRPNGL
ncbi:hypothetical protein DL764_009539 [Monosporascus ibericus]|uniref:Uncharacterized protein n=1 Tax=Monosporascus ibericus TaxID=155417 RepID=A0A4Q4SUR8_9PEZI|nr:hypothetical protein DL764_009539 [Monosporascus ibericus]